MNAPLPDPIHRSASRKVRTSANAISPRQNDNRKIEILLGLESTIRKAESANELQYILTNDTRNLINASQVLFHNVDHKGSPKGIQTVSSLAIPNRHSPSLIWLNQSIREMVRSSGEIKNTDMESACGNEPKCFRLNGENAPGGSYPFSYCMHIPLMHRSGANNGALTFLSDAPFDAKNIQFAKRIAEVGGHALGYFKRRTRILNHLINRWVIFALILATTLAMFIPVPLTVLAPVEVVAHKPGVVAAPLDGVVEKVLVIPDTQVSKGDLLFSLNAVELKSRLELADRNIAIANARYHRAKQGAFGSAESKRELAVTRAEFEMAVAERAYAAHQLKLANVHAEHDGVVLFSGVDDWIARPVKVGERVMRIANPEQTRLRIDLEVSDSVIFENGADVNAFFDTDPLNPVSANLVTQSYIAEPNGENRLVFPLSAEVKREENRQLRIGLRGTAQIYGNDVSLWFFLFRKPLSFLRQSVGW